MGRKIRVDGTLYEAVSIPGVVGEVPEKIGSRWNVHTDTGDAVTIYPSSPREDYEIEFQPAGGKLFVDVVWGNCGIVSVDTSMPDDLIAYIESVVDGVGDAVQGFVDGAEDVVSGAGLIDVVAAVLYPDNGSDFIDWVEGLVDDLRTDLRAALR